MCNNFYKIINYINDHFRFGSELKNEKVENLFRSYPITEREKGLVYDELDSLKIKVLDIDGEDKSDKFDFLDELEFDDLGTVLDDDKFIKEISRFKSVIDKSHNLEYLMEYHSVEDDFEKRNQILNSLAIANQKLVWKIALKYQSLSTVSFDIYDIYQAGMQGLMKAIEKFNINTNYQFSTYATWWIRQGITREIADYSTTIRIPVHMREKIIKYIKVQREFLEEYERVPHDTELANILNIPLDKVNELKIYKSFSNLKSLDMPIGEDEGSFIGEFISDIKQQSPEEYVEEGILKNEIKELLKKRLTLKEARIIDLRFGLTDNKTHTLEEIGKGENVTRERIRQIESKAIKKLQSLKSRERLRDFYYD